jgi:thioesterase domain-containing protein
VRSFARELGVRDLAAPAPVRGDGRPAEPELLARLFARARAEGVLADDLEPRDLERLYGVFKANLRAMHAYAGAPYGGRLHLFQAARTAARRGMDPLFGWAACARGGIEVHAFPGHHHSLLRCPTVEAVAAALKGALR